MAKKKPAKRSKRVVTRGMSAKKGATIRDVKPKKRKLRKAKASKKLPQTKATKKGQVVAAKRKATGTRAIAVKKKGCNQGRKG